MDHLFKTNLPNWKWRFFLIAMLQTPLFAHVKWFSEGSFADQPLSLQMILTPTFFALTFLSMTVISTLVFVDVKLTETRWYFRVHDWFEQQKTKSGLIMRIATGVTLLLSWQTQTMLAPEFGVETEWINWAQFGLAFTLILPQTTFLAGLGILALFGLGIYEFGVFHIIDYLYWLGIGFCLVLYLGQSQKVRRFKLLTLYITLGISLCWVALEKIVYPKWGLEILTAHPELTMGLDANFFLLASA